MLLFLLAIGLFYGLYSEGLDRLVTPHLLHNHALPGIDRLGPVVWLARHRLYALPRYTECKATLRDDGLYRSGHGVGANSVVTRDIPPRSIAAGAPAKVIREVEYR